MLLRYYREYMFAFGLEPIIKDAEGTLANIEAVIFCISFLTITLLLIYAWLCLVPNYIEKLRFAYHPFSAFLHLMDLPAMFLISALLSRIATKILMPIVCQLTQIGQPHSFKTYITIGIISVVVGAIIYERHQNG